MFKLQSETRGEQTALIEEMIEGEKVVKAFGYEREPEERFAAVNDKLQGYSLKAILLFFYYESVYPFCQQPCICKRGIKRCTHCHWRGT